MEVTLSVVATPAPGLEYKRKIEVQKLASRANNKEEKLTVDVTKSPVDLKLYDTILSWFPAEEQKNVLYTNTQVNKKTVDVSKPLDLKKKEDIVYYVLIK